MIDHFRQVLAEAAQQVVPRHATLGGERLDLVGAQRLGEIVGCDRLVLSGANPGIGGVALATLLQLFHQVSEPAGDDAARGGAAEQPAQRSLQQVAKATGKATCKTTSKTAAASKRAAGAATRAGT